MRVVDLITKAKCHTLALGADANVADDWSIWFAEWLLDAQVGQSVLPEYGTCVHVGRHKSTLARQRLIRRQALHVGALEQQLQVLVQVRH